MSSNHYLVVVYIFFWAVRINGCIRRGLQPLRRGRDWFFDVHVQPDFYEGAGKKILHRYWMRMAIPFAVDIPLALAIFLTGHVQFLALLIAGLCALIHINHCFSVDIAERQARQFAVPEAQQPVACVASPLKPRRLRDYSTAKLEWALAISSIFAVALLIRYYFAAPEHHNVRLVFGVPTLLLYLQVGMLYVKQIVLAWRSPLPQTQAAAHLAAREQTRKYYMMMCDLQRAGFATGLLFWPIRISTSPANLSWLMGAWFAVWMAINVLSFVWIEIKRQQVLNLSLRAQPVNLPDFLHLSVVRWPVCYQPSAPMLVLKGAHGYSLNLANTLARFGAVYLSGLGVLIAFMRLR